MKKDMDKFFITPILKRSMQKGLFAIFFLILLILCNGCAHNQEISGYSAPWKFAVVADTQGGNRKQEIKSSINETVLKEIVHDITAERPDFVLIAGDLVSGWIQSGSKDFKAQYAAWKTAMKPVYNAGIRVFPVRGNHDVGPERVVLPPLPAHLEPLPGADALLEQAYREAIAEFYIPDNGPDGEKGLTFSFMHKNVFVVGLDVCGNPQHKVNLKWLDNEFAMLDKTRKKLSDNSKAGSAEISSVRQDDKRLHVFVYAHEPAYQVRHRDCLAVYKEDRNAFWDLMGKAKTRVYFCGHDHLYNRAVVADSAGNEIRQIVVGTGGGRLVQWSGVYEEAKRVKGEHSVSGYHGYVLVTIEGNKATLIWKAMIPQEDGGIRWQELDSFSYILQ